MRIVEFMHRGNTYSCVFTKHADKYLISVSHPLTIKYRLKYILHLQDFIASDLFLLRQFCSELLDSLYFIYGKYVSGLTI